MESFAHSDSPSLAPFFDPTSDPLHPNYHNSTATKHSRSFSQALINFSIDELTIKQDSNNDFFGFGSNLSNSTNFPLQSRHSAAEETNASATIPLPASFKPLPMAHKRRTSLPNLNTSLYERQKKLSVTKSSNGHPTKVKTAAANTSELMILGNSAQLTVSPLKTRQLAQ
jgi:hypothetical protein